MSLTDEALGPGGDVGLVLDEDHVRAADDDGDDPDGEDDEEGVPGGEAWCQWMQDAHVPETQHLHLESFLNNQISLNIQINKVEVGTFPTFDIVFNSEPFP